MVRNAALMTKCRKRRMRKCVLSAWKVVSCSEKAFWKAVTSPTRTAGKISSADRHEDGELTLHDLEVRRQRLSKHRSSEHRSVRDNTGEQHNDDVVFVNLPSSAFLVPNRSRDQRSGRNQGPADLSAPS